MAYKYLAWKERGYWQGGNLLSSSQLAVAKQHLPEHVEKFETVQSYEADGTAIACPIFADFDHAQVDTARKDAIAFTKAVQYHLNVVPDIYFSGNKGFHIIVPYQLTHPRCHLIAKGMIGELTPRLQSLDDSVYRTKSLLRLLNSPASKPGSYKVKLTKAQLFDEPTAKILEFARKRRLPDTPEFDLAKINEGLLEELFAKVTSTLKDYTSAKAYGLSMTPCLQTILQHPVPEGQRNRSVFILAKFFKGAGSSEKEAIDAMLAQDHYRTWDQRRELDVGSVVRSVFRNRMSPSIGCKTGIDGELLRDYCNDFCVFSDKFPDLYIGGSSEPTARKVSPPR